MEIAGDAYSVALIAIIVIMIILVSLMTIKAFMRETDFEEAYGENALRLLVDERNPKGKSLKSVKNKFKKNDRKKESIEKRKKSLDEAQKVSVVISSGNNKLATTSKIQSTDDAVQEKPIEEPEGSSVHTDLSEKLVLIENSAIVETAVPSGGEKAKKKNRLRRTEDQANLDDPRNGIRQENNNLDNASVQIETRGIAVKMKNNEGNKKKLDDVVPETTTYQNDSKRVEKRITKEMVQNRVRDLSELEPDYKNFLDKYLNETGIQVGKLEKEKKKLHETLSDQNRLIRQLKSRIETIAEYEADIAKLDFTLSEERKKHFQYEQTITSRMVQHSAEIESVKRSRDQVSKERDELKIELRKLQSALRAIPPPVDVKPYQKQIDNLTSELESLKNNSVQMEANLMQKNQTLQKLKSEIQVELTTFEKRLTMLSEDKEHFEKQAKEVETEKHAAQEAYESKLKNVLSVVNSLERTTERLEDELQKRVAYIEMTDEDNKQLKAQFDALEDDFFKNNFLREELEKELAICKKREIDSENSLNEANINVKALECELEELKMKKQADERVIYVTTGCGTDSMNSENMITPKEKIEIKQSVNATKECHLEDELLKLRQQLNEQMHRNDELRESNYKLVEVSQKQEQLFRKQYHELQAKNANLMEEICETLIENLGIASNMQNISRVCTVTDFRDWLENILNIFMEANKISQQISSQKAPILNKNIAADETHVRDEKEFNYFLLETYRAALENLKTTVKTIEEESAKKEKFHKSEISILKELLQRETIMCSHPLTYRDDHLTN